MKTASLLLLVVVAGVIPRPSDAKEKLLVVSVATEKISGYERFVRSLTQFGYEYKVFGLGEKWKGGDVANSIGGGQKINILKRELEKYNTDPELVVLFTDGYDVILTEEPENILDKFRSMKARVVFGAETFCWPDQSLIDAYPPVEKNQKRFLNSGGFIGYIEEIFELLGSGSIKDDEDDQLYYTKLFLNKPTRDKLNIKLDVDSEIFLNLNGAQSEIEVVESVNKEYYRVFNTLSDTYPSVIHGNGPSKLILNRIGNYIAKAYSQKEGCLICNENTIKLPENTADWPEVTIGVFIEVATPFLREFFEKLAKLNYPRNKISLLVHNNVKYHSKQVESFLNDPKNEYYSVKYIAPEDDTPEHEARSEALQECIKNKCKYYLSIDSTSHIDNPHTLKLLIEQNRPILTPIMTRPGTTWSNVWGAVNEQGFYARSDDYLDIVNRKLIGVWNVPYINEVILVRSDAIKTPLVFEDPFLDPIMSFNKKLRDSNVFMYATNRHIFGHLIDPDNFNTSVPRPEVYEITSNLEDWTARYIRPEYFKFLSGEEKPLQPCPDVFWFPVVTDEFCDDLITTVETHGGWSGGNNNNKDTRIPGGYENVPTVDIHMTQVGFQEGWLKLLKSFIMPIQQKIFIGYYHDPPEAMLNFVVRYRPGEQDHLRPHHDASTYTMNIALNKPDIDFEGGGCRFVRYNCSVTKTVKGWAMIHPGRLTHYHEGLKVTAGTRYIMVSFIDP